MANQNYTLGRGKLYFSRFIPDTQDPAGYEYIGNTPELNLTIETENLDHFSSDAGIREKDDSVPLEVNRTGSFTTDSVKPENIAFFFFGENSVVTIVGDTVEDEEHDDVQLGRYYQLGQSASNPVGNRNVSAVSVGGDNSVAANEDGTFSGTGSEGDTITIGVRVYTLTAALVDANDVLIGSSASETAFNMEQAINGGDGAGFLYHAGTVVHADVSAQSAAAVLTVTAKVPGTAGNAIALAESGTGFSWAGGAVFLSGGTDATVGVAAAGNWEVDLVNGILHILEDAADITDGEDITVSYTYASGDREQILSGSEPVEGAMMFVANNPKGHDFNYIMPWVKITPNGDYALKGDEWQTIPFSLEILKPEDKNAIYVDGAPFVY